MSKRYFICLAGIDGSGKSTVSTEVLKRLKEYKYIWARWEPFFLKPFIRLLSRRINSAKGSRTEESVHVYKKWVKKRILSSPFIKQIWLFLAECDYFLQLIFKVCLPVFLNKKILCDRYIYDFYVDQLINIGGASQQLSWFIHERMLSVFPKPDLLIYIKISPETGHKRKNDGTSLAYLKERKDYYDNLKTLYNTVEIDGEEKLEMVISRVFEAIGFVGGDDCG